MDLGKARVKAMIEAFGGRVTSAVSGKTTALLVGKEPGLTKVAAAHKRKTVQLLDIKSLKEEGIEAGRLENAVPVVIETFSAGYSRAEKRVTAAPPKQRATSKKGKTPKPSGTKKSTKKRGPDEQEDETQPPAPKKTSKTGAASEPENESGPPAPKKPKKKPAAKKKAGTKTKAFNVNCDGCGVDCTEKSWFVSKDDTDWCEACVGKGIAAVPQINGVDVPCGQE